MTRLLQAQAAQLAGDRQAAIAAYIEMLEHDETHALALRGLHVEARRASDHEAALQYARRANANAPAAWAGQAVLDDHTRRGDWAGALATVDSNAAARLIDKPTANRWRAVIKTAMAEEQMERNPKGAMALAQEACRLAPTLVPPRRFTADWRRRPATTGGRRKRSRAPMPTRPIRIWPQPISGCATAIRPRTGWPARACSPGLRRTTRNRC